MELILGTRGSPLALAQTHGVREGLRRAHPDLRVEIRIIRTHGDVSARPLRELGGLGAFTREIEHALLQGEVDVAVHSLKDLPTEMPEALELAAVPEREDVRDVLVTAGARSLSELPEGARVGTGSLRRRAQLLALRPDLGIRELRGNLDTRLAQVEEGRLDALVLAAAGLHRLGRRERIGFYLSPEEMLPAVGQGALGLQTRREDPARQWLAPLNDPPTLAAVRAERALLRTLGAGCHAPVGAWARPEEDGSPEGGLRMEGMVAQQDGTRILRVERRGRVDQAEALGRRTAEALLQMGARAFLRTCPL